MRVKFLSLFVLISAVLLMHTTKAKRKNSKKYKKGRLANYEARHERAYNQKMQETGKLIDKLKEMDVDFENRAVGTSRYFDEVKEKAVEVLPMPMTQLSNLVFVNVTQPKLDCFAKVFNVLNHKIDTFLSSMESCPKNIIYSQTFEKMVQPSYYIKDRISNILASCKNSHVKSSKNVGCMQKLVAELYDLNRSLIELTEIMFFTNKANADKCKLPSVQALLCTSLVFIGDVFYCNIKAKSIHTRH